MQQWRRGKAGIQLEMMLLLLLFMSACLIPVPSLPCVQEMHKKVVGSKKKSLLRSCYFQSRRTSYSFVMNCMNPLSCLDQPLAPVLVLNSSSNCDHLWQLWRIRRPAAYIKACVAVGGWHDHESSSSHYAIKQKMGHKSRACRVKMSPEWRKRFSI